MGVKKVNDINYFKLNTPAPSAKFLKSHLRELLIGSYKVLPRLHSFWGQVQLTKDNWRLLVNSKMLAKKRKHVAFSLLLAQTALKSSISTILTPELLEVWSANLGNKKMKDHKHA